LLLTFILATKSNKKSNIMAKATEPVRLRTREMPSGNTTLYLDIYIDGKRRYEYLHLYLIPEVTRADRAKNKETLRLAEAIKAKRLVEFQNGLYGFNDAYQLNTNFLAYYRRLCEERHGTMSLGNWGNWLSVALHTHLHTKDADRGYLAN
jgi:L-ascorbate metabolism protein UlaG (beta-lactamase superfamily)